MGHFQGGVPDLSGLFAKDGPEQALLRGEVGLPLGGHLAHQDVPRVDLRAHSDNAPLIQVFQGVVAHVGDVTGNLFRPQLGVPGLGLILLNVNGGKDIVLDHSLIEQDGVLVVVALPGHKAHEDVLAQGDLPLVGGGAVRNDIPLFHPVPEGHNGPLVDAGAVVGTEELNKGIVHHIPSVIPNRDIGGGDPGHFPIPFGQNGNFRVDTVFMLHPCGHNGGLGGEQRHSLPLHVGAHQGPVGVVVFQEGNHGRGDGDHHLGRHVDVVHLFPVHFHDLVAVAAGNPLIGQAAVLVHRLRGLAHHELVLNIRRHVLHLIGEEPCLLIHLAVRGLNEAVAIDAGVGGQVGDQTDVGTFRGLNGAHPAIVAVMDVPDIKGGPVPGQTAGAQGGHTPLVGQLCQGVGLVHELGQRGGAKELLNGSRHRTDVNEGLGGDNVQVLNGHSLPNHPFHPAKTDAELVLEQFAHAAQAAVAQVVNVVRGAHAVGEGAQVVDGGHHVIHNDVLGHQVVLALGHGLLQGGLVLAELVQQLTQDLEANLFGNAARLRVEGDKLGHVHHAVGENLDALPVHIHDGFRHPSVLQFLGLGPGQGLARLGNDLTGAGVRHRRGQLLAGKPGPQGELFVEFIPSHRGQVITAGVKEKAVDEGLR